MNFAATMPLAGTLGVTIDEASKHRVTGKLPVRPEICTAGNIVHGGAIMALADSAGGAAAFANLPQGSGGTSTIESKTNFLGAVREGTVTATAKPLHIGGSTIVIETELRNDTGKLVGKVTQTQTVLRPRA